jgi:MoxR-like ATPase
MMTAAAPIASTDDVALAQRLRSAHEQLLTELERIIVGQRQVIDELLITIFARGHCLLVGVPGLAKTLLVSTLADALDLSFKRIQFTPDLKPSDITGTEVIQDDPTTGRRAFKFLRGPIFANEARRHLEQLMRTTPMPAADLDASATRLRTLRLPTTRPVRPSRTTPSEES